MKRITKYITIITVIVFISLLQMSCSTKKSSSLDTTSKYAVASAGGSTQSDKKGVNTTEEIILPDSILSTSPSTTDADPYSGSIDTPNTFPEMEITPPFDIMKISLNKRPDNAESLYVLIPTVNLTQRKYVTHIKNIVKKLIVYEGYSETISILIFDDEDSLKKIYQNPHDPDFNIPSHFIARYDGHKKGVTYQYNLTIFPLAPKSNSYVRDHHDIIKFNPFNW